LTQLNENVSTPARANEATFRFTRTMCTSNADLRPRESLH
jgi:hypothetical protein